VKQKIILLASVFILAIIMSGAVSATPQHDQIYVSPDGDDNNDGLTPETAVQTINVGINKVADNGLVNLGPGTYNKNINGDSKDVDIKISKNLTLQGSGKGSTIIDAQGNSQIFDIDYDLIVLITGITFKNGKFDNSGGAISSDATLTVKDCEFINNQALNDGGGAIFTHTTLNVINCVFTNNKADAGGAIFNKGGDLTVTGSTFSGNQASTDPENYMGGGAIFNQYPGTFQIIGNTFLNNVGSTIKLWNPKETNSEEFEEELMDNTNNIPANKINFNRIVGNSQFGIYQVLDLEKSSGIVDAKYNWWGSNNPDFQKLVSGNIDYTPWLYMKFNSNSIKVKKGDNVSLIASFNYLYDGKTVTVLDPALGHIPDGTPVLFTTNLGEVGSKSVTKYTINGIATATLRATESGTALVSAATDSQVLSSNIVISAAATVNNQTTAQAANTIAMQTTGFPMAALLLAILMIAGGIIGSKK
jgi:predicted outer membrane repeat protein